MDYRKRWEILEELGEGGQGRVYRVIDDSKIGRESDIFPKIRDLLHGFASEKDLQAVRKNFPSLRILFSKLAMMDDPSNQGALKVLHEPKESRDPERAQVRIKSEIQAMSEMTHPNLIKILDYDPEAKWFVTQFHPSGSLSKNRNRFVGDFPGALKAFRPLVEGVSELHKRGRVHRDIKPENVFVDSFNNLVLGDFGLIFFTDEKHTRISGTFENVGSRDWMPAWAMSMRIEDVKASFDVFSLGKLLWAMVSSKPILRLWYFYRDDFNLEKMFPDALYIDLANRLFKKCIVENEEDCVPDATALLREVDLLLSIVNKNADFIDDKAIRACKVCGMGNYDLVGNRSAPIEEDFGIRPTGNSNYKIFTCNHCGNVQTFFFPEGKVPPAWT